jgi:uncharacterized protein YciI
MYIIDISYTASLDDIDATLSDHQKWLDTQYSAGRFLASGRQEPRTGGIIIAVDQPRDEIEALAATDPVRSTRSGAASDHRVPSEPDASRAGLDRRLSPETRAGGMWG